jgi:hypothetical protein
MEFHYPLMMFETKMLVFAEENRWFHNSLSTLVMAE